MICNGERAETRADVMDGLGVDVYVIDFLRAAVGDCDGGHGGSRFSASAMYGFAYVLDVLRADIVEACEVLDV